MSVRVETVVRRPNWLDRKVYEFFRWWWNPIFRADRILFKTVTEHIFEYQRATMPRCAYPECERKVMAEGYRFCVLHTPTD